MSVSHSHFLSQDSAANTTTVFPAATWPTTSPNGAGAIPAWSKYGCWTIDQVAQQFPEARFLFFYDAIEDVAQSAESEAADFVEIWQASARNIVSAVHQHRTRCHLLSANECCANPEVFRQWLAANAVLDANVLPDSSVPAKDNDDIRAVILKLLGCYDSSLKKLSEELYNLAQPLSDCAPHTPITPTETISLLRDGLALSTKMSGEKDSLAVKEQEMEKRYLENCEMLLHELQNAHKESEDFFEKLEGATGKIAHLKADLERANLRAGENRFRVGRIKLKGFREKQPHSHVDFIFHAVKMPGKTFDQLPLRLLWHHGKAGLALFRDTQRPYAPLHHWTAAGNERGSEFMTVLPEDPASESYLASCTGSDFAFIRFACECLRDYLGTALVSPPKGARNSMQVRRWRRVAQQVIEALDRLPDKVRYDEVLWRNAGSDEALDLSILNLAFRQRLWSEVKLRWVAGRKLDILVSPDGDVPLVGWPRGKNLSPAESLSLPLNNKGALGSVAKSLTPSDRRFCSLLLRAMPDFVHHGLEQGKLPPTRKSSLRSEALQASKSARVFERSDAKSLLTALKTTR